MSAPYILLDPDGRAGFGLVVVVHARTGVRYANECGGLGPEERAVEGFLVPVSSRQRGDGERMLQRDYHEQALVSLFRPFGGQVPHGDAAWPDGFLDAVDHAVSDIAMWRTSSGDGCELCTLGLDRARLAELTEAWLPVTTPYGPGTLMFRNKAWR